MFIVLLFFILLSSTAFSASELDSLKRAADYLHGKDKINSLNSIADIYLSKNIDSSKSYAEQAISLSQKLKYKEGEGKANYIYASACLKEGNTEKAIDFFKRAIILYEYIKDKPSAAMVRKQLESLLNKTKNYDKALDYYMESLNIYEQTGNKWGIANSMNNIGIIYKKFGKYDQALKFYKKALKIYQELNDKQGIATCMNNIGTIYYRLGSAELPETEILSEPIREEVGFEKEISVNLKRRTTLSVNPENLPSSKQNPHNKYDLALNYLNKSQKLAKEENLKELLLSNYKNFSDIFLAQGDYEKALAYYKLMYKVRDSLYAEESNRKISELEVIYQTKAKEKEIELLKKDKEIQALELVKQKTIRNFAILSSGLILILAIVIYMAYRIKKKANWLLEAKNRELLSINEKLQDLNLTKDKFFSIIAHDLKNPISAFLANSMFLAKRFHELPEQEVVECIGDINKIALLLDNLLENLLIWAKSQIGLIPFQPEVIDLSEVVSHNIFSFKKDANEKNIHIISGIEPKTRVYADLNSMIIIVGNLLSNAIKFTPSGGTIKMESRATGSHVEFSITDNGRGMSGEEMKNLFKIDTDVTLNNKSTAGGSGLGLIISKEFIERNGGKIRVESQPHKGSTFIFTVPKPEES